MITDVISPATFASTKAIHPTNPQLSTLSPDYAITLRSPVTMSNPSLSVDIQPHAEAMKLVARSYQSVSWERTRAGPAWPSPRCP
jgi:hypothetical protein